MTSVAAYTQAFASYVVASPTAYHTVAEGAAALRRAGFSEFFETEPWQITPGLAGFVRRDGALIAWRVGLQARADAAMRIIGAHSDSPGFKVKPEPDTVTAGWSQLNIEVYGGPQYSSWVDRDLAIAGLVVDSAGKNHLVKTAAVARIPSLAIHLDGSANKSLQLNPQQHLHPVLGVSGESARELIASAAGIAADDIAGWDLQLADTQAPAVIGASGDFLSSGRLDNLTGTFAGLHAIVHAAQPQNQVLLTVIYDHEEVGSLTHSGACGTFLNDVITRLLSRLGTAEVSADTDALLRARAKSVLLSIDAGHSVHPNYTEKHDPEARPLAGGGAMLKINANQHYASSAQGAALWHRITRQAGVKSQVFVSNNAVSCGTTIGPISAANLGIATIDCGVPLLSMHSVRELVHTADLWSMAQLGSAFLSDNVT
ncbi:M18 family aminopeptidase [Canibacter sp. lx-72]|nr:M18 family aminopeptidase [Canibacter zhuwentaonis]MBT1035611.1 M18 family aminopeptidase [Canibacter zhuwentaonis]